MKTMPCYPKVILHRLGGPSVVPRRLPPTGPILLLLMLAVLTAKAFRARSQAGDPSILHLSSLR